MSPDAGSNKSTVSNTPEGAYPGENDCNCPTAPVKNAAPAQMATDAKKQLLPKTNAEMLSKSKNGASRSKWLFGLFAGLFAILTNKLFENLPITSRIVILCSLLGAGINALSMTKFEKIQFELEREFGGDNAPCLLTKPPSEEHAGTFTSAYRLLAATFWIGILTGAVLVVNLLFDINTRPLPTFKFSLLQDKKKRSVAGKWKAETVVLICQNQKRSEKNIRTEYEFSPKGRVIIKDSFTGIKISNYKFESNLLKWEWDKKRSTIFISGLLSLFPTVHYY